MKRKARTGYTIVELIIAMIGLFVVAAIGFTLYCVVHFIGKAW